MDKKIKSTRTKKELEEDIKFYNDRKMVMSSFYGRLGLLCFKLGFWLKRKGWRFLKIADEKYHADDYHQ